MLFYGPPLLPRNGIELWVLIIARISTIHQDRRSLDDQVALCKEYLRLHYQGVIHWEIIASQGSGEILDRVELQKAEEWVESRTFDLVIVEDLARLSRRNRAIDFCELCEDADTRFIAINDHLDTARGDWRVNGLVTSFKHEQHNTTTSQRLKERLRERFKSGGAFPCPIYGYCKPADAAGEDEVTRDPVAEAVYDEWFRLLEDGARYSEVADWLNGIGVKPGPSCRDTKWSGRMVRRVTFNPILKGQRLRNVKESRRVNKTGRRRSVDAPPSMRLARDCPHLAFIEPGRYDRVIRLLQAKNARYARGRRRESGDSRKGVSKKRTVWPGQHLTCGICGRAYYWGGHGQAEHMMCSGARDYLCWNGATCDGLDTARRLTQAILREIESLPGFDQALLDKVRASVEDRGETRKGQLARSDREMEDVFCQINNVADAIARLGFNEVLREKLAALEARRDGLRASQARLKREPLDSFKIPTMEEIKVIARETIEQLPADSQEFGRLMRRLVPYLGVYPHRLCDGGAVVLRAKLTLNLLPLADGWEVDTELEGMLQREVYVDLFDPPQRVQIREQMLALRAEGLTERHIAAKLKVTVTAAQRAAALSRIMERDRLTDPYVPVTTPPGDSSKLRRHLHARYDFTPLG